MFFLFFGRKYRNLVAVMYEGPGRLRLNANRKAGRDLERAKRGAMVYEGTVCWFILDDTGQCLERGEGPAASNFSREEIAEMLRQLPQHSAMIAVVRELLQYQQDKASKILNWAQPGQQGSKVRS